MLFLSFKGMNTFFAPTPSTVYPFFIFYSLTFSLIISFISSSLDIVSYSDKPDEEVYHGSSILVLCLCVSVVINIVLIISLIFQKKKNITMRYDPRERTDFDI